MLCDIFFYMINDFRTYDNANTVLINPVHSISEEDIIYIQTREKNTLQQTL